MYIQLTSGHQNDFVYIVRVHDHQVRLATFLSLVQMHNRWRPINILLYYNISLLILDAYVHDFIHHTRHRRISYVSYFNDKMLWCLYHILHHRWPWPWRSRSEISTAQLERCDHNESKIVKLQENLSSEMVVRENGTPVRITRCESHTVQTTTTTKTIIIMIKTMII